MDFLKENAGHYQSKRILSFLLSKDDENYLNILLQFYHTILMNAGTWDWTTMNIGSFFVKTLNWATNLNKYKCSKYDCECDIQVENEIHKLFTIPGQNVSIPDIAYWYSLIDFRQIIYINKATNPKTMDEHEKMTFFKTSPNIKIQKSFKACLNNFKSNTSNISEKKAFIFDKNMYAVDNLQISPCMNLNQYPQCAEYCNWHKTYFDKSNMEDFSTIMNYAFLQRKVLLDSITPNEKNLAKKLFGSTRTKNLEYFLAPSSMILFCHKMNEGFFGDKVGPFERYCNDFFPTPTDNGVCLTKNLINTREIIHLNEPTNIFTTDQHSKKQPEKYINGGAVWGQETFVIFTDQSNRFSQSYERKPDLDYYNKALSKIELQIHQINEFGQFFQDNNNDKETTSLTLQSSTMKALNVYEIEVTPNGQIATEDFNNLNINQRGCKLENEIEDDSIFKIYTENNCKYECYTSLAMKTCKCIPWDFVSKDRKPECDVFGRTCFFDAMKNLTQFHINLCNHCIKSCDFIKYNRKMTMNSPPISRYIKHKGGHQLWGDKGLKNFLKSINYPAEHYDSKSGENLIVVHLKFMQPNIDIVDTKYTWLDKFASFGGKFGIFAQLTGCSLLGLLNLCFLTFKLLFTSHYQ